MISRMALGLIWGYQQYVSPYKGFRCAHSVMHGGPGCSGYAKERIRDVGVITAIGEIRKRLRECGQAAHALHQERSDCEESADDVVDRSSKKRRHDGKDNRSFMDACDCSVLGCEAATLPFRGCGLVSLSDDVLRGCGGFGGRGSKGCDMDGCDCDIGGCG